MTNREWLQSLTQEQFAAMFGGGNARKLNQRAREVWLGAKHTKDDEVFTLEKKVKEGHR